MICRTALFHTTLSDLQGHSPMASKVITMNSIFRTPHRSEISVDTACRAVPLRLLSLSRRAFCGHFTPVHFVVYIGPLSSFHIFKPFKCTGTVQSLPLNFL